MALGTVKWFSAEKGFGFIAPMDGSEDVRFHASALERDGLNLLVEGQRVRYEVVVADEQRIAEHLSIAG
jgi:CspA family cold shock protein